MHAGVVDAHAERTVRAVIAAFITFDHRLHLAKQPDEQPAELLLAQQLQNGSAHAIGDLEINQALDLL